MNDNTPTTTTDWWSDHLDSSSTANTHTVPPPPGAHDNKGAPQPATPRQPWPVAVAAIAVIAVVTYALGSIGGDDIAGVGQPSQRTSLESSSVAEPPPDARPAIEADEVPDREEGSQRTPVEPDDARAGASESREDVEPMEPGAPLTGTYSLTIRGEISGRSFERSADLIVVDTIDRVARVNGVNPVDVCLVSGFPAGDPEIGAIRFGSNSGCLPSTLHADIDLARVELDGDTVRVEPDESVMALGYNTLTANEGLMALIYWVQAGDLTLNFDGDAVSGTIEVRGYCGPCTFGPGSDGAWYTAEISGRRT